MSTVLVCDDDKEIVASIKIYLNSAGFDVITAFNGFEAVKLLKERNVDCAVMDIMMPVMDGIEALEEIRTFSDVPIIFLSAKSEDEDKIVGLGYGADDYVTKPFSPMVLIARIKAHIRRFTAYSQNESDVISTGALSLNKKTKHVTLDGKEILLTATEYGILEYLMTNMGQLLSIDSIYNHVWQQSAISGDKTVTVHIRRIREKIEADPRHPMYLKVVWGMGYKIEKI